MVETVGLVRPQRGGKRGFAARYVISALRPVFTLMKASRKDKINMGEIKLPHIYFGVLCDAFKVVETVGLEPTTSCM